VSPFRGSLGALDVPAYRWLFSGNIGFFFAMQGQAMIVRPWIAYQMTGSALALGAVSFAAALPMIFFPPLGGVLADRHDRRNLILLFQSVVIVNEILGLTLFATGWLRYWHLIVLTFVNAGVFPFIMPARQAIVANVVGRQRLANAMALSMTGMNAARVAAPPLAGWLIGAIGVIPTWIFSISLYAITTLSLVRVPKCAPPDGARSASMGAKLMEGVRYLGQEKLVLMLLVFGLIPMFLMMPFQSLLVVFSENVYHAGSQGLGLLNAAAGLGGVVGSLVIAARGRSGGRLPLMLGGVLGFGGFLLLFTLAPDLRWALPCIFAANLCASIYGVVNNTAIQMVIPDEVRGRVSAFLMLSFSLPMLGTLPLSAVAQRFGAPVAVGSAAVVAMIAGLVFVACSRELRGVDTRLAHLGVD
jgi:MFS family permease